MDLVIILLIAILVTVLGAWPIVLWITTILAAIVFISMLLNKLTSSIGRIFSKPEELPAQIPVHQSTLEKWINRAEDNLKESEIDCPKPNKQLLILFVLNSVKDTYDGFHDGISMPINLYYRSLSLFYRLLGESYYSNITFYSHSRISNYIYLISYCLGATFLPLALFISWLNL